LRLVGRVSEGSCVLSDGVTCKEPLDLVLLLLVDDVRRVNPLLLPEGTVRGGLVESLLLFREPKLLVRQSLLELGVLTRLNLTNKVLTGFLNDPRDLSKHRLAVRLKRRVGCEVSPRLGVECLALLLARSSKHLAFSPCSSSSRVSQLTRVDCALSESCSTV